MDWLPIIIAPFIGSFLGVLIRRLPAGQSVVLARSVCMSCGRTLTARDLVPVASFLILRGRCRICRAPIDPFHVAIEIAATLIAVWAALTMTGPEWIWASCLLGWMLLALAWIDAEHMLLPDVLTLPLLLAGLGCTVLLQPQNATNHALGAASGYIFFRAIAALYRRYRGRTGLGGGDAKLLAAAGAWLGWQALPWVVVEASLGGIAAILIAGLLGHRISRTTAVPFGSFLAAAAWLVWLYGLPLPQ